MDKNINNVTGENEKRKAVGEEQGLMNNIEKKVLMICRNQNDGGILS